MSFYGNYYGGLGYGRGSLGCGYGSYGYTSYYPCWHGRFWSSGFF
uniref:Keratin associated protein 22-1 n=1 Tax=Neovison vison TaxID=452646 RepID=A0A8C7AB20_NEOVI